MSTLPRLGTSASLFERDRMALLAGAHDALSAHLIGEAGFDGVWASSFGISLASRCLPDTDVMTMSENVDAVHQMVAAVDIPVIADVSAGYGNALNVRRLVGELATRGAAGACIEDNPFPKVCSLYGGWDRQLIDREEMAGKIRAAKSAAMDPSFAVIARTEALIADLGVDEALVRIEAYTDAGADAVVVHAKQYDAWQEFVSRWDGSCPLVVIPTLFPQVSFAELEAHGARVAIYPNQAVRASVRSMQQALQTIMGTQAGTAVEEQIVPLSEVYRIVDLDGVREAEKEFVLQPAEGELAR